MNDAAPNIRLDIDALSSFAPFVIVTDKNLKIVWASAAVRRRFSQIEGADASAIISIKGQNADLSVIANSAADKTAHEIMLNIGVVLNLTGVWLSSENGFVMLARPRLSGGDITSQFFPDEIPSFEHISQIETMRGRIEANNGDTIRARERLVQAANALDDSQMELSKKLQIVQDQRRAIMNILSDVEESRNQLRTINISLASEIAERKMTEDRLRSALSEKETLLKEIHHRVKNNLQVISSLLRLQSSATRDKKVTAAFKDSENRIRSMAIIHESLYGTGDLAKIDFGIYIKSLTRILYESYGIGAAKIPIDIRVEGISFGIETAIPCGLVVNELVSNAVKYAFPDERSGRIAISLKNIDTGRFELIVEDDGIGLPENFDPKASTSLGLRLVYNLVENQLGGSIDIHSGQGTKFIITFKEVKYTRRY